MSLSAKKKCKNKSILEILEHGKQIKIPKFIATEAKTQSCDFKHECNFNIVQVRFLKQTGGVRITSLYDRQPLPVEEDLGLFRSLHYKGERSSSRELNHE